MLLFVVIAVVAAVDVCLPEQFTQVGFCYGGAENIVLRHVFWDWQSKKFRLNNYYTAPEQPRTDYIFYFEEQMMYISIPDKKMCKHMPFKDPMTPHCPLKNATKDGETTIAMHPAMVYGTADGKKIACNEDAVPGYCVPFTVWFPGGQPPPNNYLMGLKNVTAPTLVQFSHFTPTVKDSDFALPPECKK